MQGPRSPPRRSRGRLRRSRPRHAHSERWAAAAATCHVWSWTRSVTTPRRTPLPRATFSPHAGRAVFVEEQEPPHRAILTVARSAVFRAGPDRIRWFSRRVQMPAPGIRPTRRSYTRAARVVEHGDARVTERTSTVSGARPRSEEHHRWSRCQPRRGWFDGPPSARVRGRDPRRPEVRTAVPHARQRVHSARRVEVSRSPPMRKPTGCVTCSRRAVGGSSRAAGSLDSRIPCSSRMRVCATSRSRCGGSCVGSVWTRCSSWTRPRGQAGGSMPRLEPLRCDRSSLGGATFFCVVS